MKNAESNASLNRRNFLAGGAAAAVTFSILQPKLVWGSDANSKIKVGVIGCGGRGAWIAELFSKNPGFAVTAAHDYFQDRVNGVGEKLKIDSSRLFSGLNGYKKLIESGVEAVAIETPPYFHPEQVEAAVNAGAHVYLAKPMAVDVPGCLSILENGRKAGEKKRCFLVDFQTRCTAPFVEAIGRVHQGAIGEFVFGEATYHAEDPFTGKAQYWKADPNNAENRLRAWGLDRALSGDIITEQNIHTLDVMNWIMEKPPISAYGTGGRKVRTVGDCWDTFSILFQYANQVAITFSSRQFFGHRTAPEGIRNRMFGTKGVLETEYGGAVMIRSEDPYNGGKTPGIYQEGAVTNIATFQDSIRKGDFRNPTLEPSIQSNLITILGRKASYENRVVTWDEIMKDRTRLEPKLQGLKA